MDRKEGSNQEGLPRDEVTQMDSDLGCQLTSTNFMADCRVLGCKRIFTSYNNPKGNVDTERVFRTVKDDLIRLGQWYSFEQLISTLENWVNDYNTDFPHSGIGQLTP